jgi:20S proteasome alpha/beta subunit
MDPRVPSFSSSGKEEAPKTGTTIVACEYDGGIVIGADTRVSTGTREFNDLSLSLFFSISHA